MRSIKGNGCLRQKMEKRMEEIEREQFKSSQYSRRDTIEITGIPGDISNDALEDEIIRSYLCRASKCEWNPVG